MPEASHIDSRLAQLADLDFATRASGPTPLLRPLGERRNLDARRRLCERVRNEFMEMPGTSLTLSQAARLFGIGTDACGRILSELIRNGEIRLSPDSRYRLRSVA